MRVDIGDTEKVSYDRAKRSTTKLLAKLHEHHDSRMFTPEGWTKAVVVDLPEPTPEYKELWFGVPEEIEQVAPVEQRIPLIEEIQRAVARVFNVSRSDIISERRTKEVVLPRHVAVYLSKELTRNSLPSIGRKFGGRDHTTVLHACRKIAALKTTSHEITRDFDSLLKVLRS